MYNLLKLENSIRGNIGEEIALNYIKGGVRCKDKFLRIPSNCGFNSIHKNFLEKYWKYLDIVRYNYEAKSFEIFEVKTRKHYHLKNFSWRKHTISPFMMNLYKEAVSKGITVKLFEIIFETNWDFSFKVKEFDEKLFSLSVSRGKNYKKFR